MLVDLTHDEIMATIEAVEMRKDSAIDTKRDVDPTELTGLCQYIENLDEVIIKLRDSLGS